MSPQASFVHSFAPPVCVSAVMIVAHLVTAGRLPSDSRPVAPTALPPEEPNGRYAPRCGDRAASQGSQLPFDAVFRDETGHEVELGDYFKDRPVVVVLV